MKSIYQRILQVIEPEAPPTGTPEDILRSNGWNDIMINTLIGRRKCLQIEVQRLKRSMWLCLPWNRCE